MGKLFLYSHSRKWRPISSLKSHMLMMARVMFYQRRVREQVYKQFEEEKKKKKTKEGAKEKVIVAANMQSMAEGANGIVAVQ